LEPDPSDLTVVLTINAYTVGSSEPFRLKAVRPGFYISFVVGASSPVYSVEIVSSSSEFS
jgi:hypothetical protein